jgi:UDP-2,3-diacylglucosamine hydrolase
MLAQFLNTITPHMSHLYIVGDLFEFWFEYKSSAPKRYRKILTTLCNIIDNGIPIHYLLGNHEVMVGSYLENVGFTIHEQPTTFTIHGRRVLVAHGDKIDRRTWSTVWEYLLTSKVNRTLYQLLPPGIGIVIAQSVAALSRRRPFSADISATLETYARTHLQNNDVVVLGHSHIPAFAELIDKKYYINLGDWIGHFTYASIDAEKVSLKRYDNQST